MRFIKMKMFLTAVIMLSALSCSKDNNDADSGFTHGVFIVNEGAFQGNNGSITHFDKKSATATPHLFQSANEMRSLGDVVQSFSVIADMGFIVVNNSQKVEVVDMESFESITSIHGIDYPRFMLGVSDEKAYLSDGSMDGYIYLVDLNTMLINPMHRIAVGKGPEQMIKAGDKVYVANSGGWAKDSTLSVIDPVTDAVVGSIHVGMGPTDMVEDKNGNIWVYCRGHYSFDDQYNMIIEDLPCIVSVDKTNHSVINSYDISITGGFFSPNRLAESSDGSTLYFLEVGGIYKMNIDDQFAPATPIIAGNYYGVDVDPSNGDIYAMPVKFDGNAEVEVYDKDGNKIRSFEAGIAPNAAVFN